jgi:hypothetical protein
MELLSEIVYAGFCPAAEVDLLKAGRTVFMTPGPDKRH